MGHQELLGDSQANVGTVSEFRLYLHVQREQNPKQPMEAVIPRLELHTVGQLTAGEPARYKHHGTVAKVAGGGQGRWPHHRGLPRAPAPIGPPWQGWKELTWPDSCPKLVRRQH